MSSSPSPPPMSAGPEFTGAPSPRRRPPSAQSFSPSRSALVSRSNSNASSSASANKKRPRADELLNDLPEDTTMIHDPLPTTPPSTQSPKKASRRPGSGEQGSSGDRSGSPDRKMTAGISLGRGGRGGGSPDSTSMPAPMPSGRVVANRGGGAGEGRNGARAGGRDQGNEGEGQNGATVEEAVEDEHEEYEEEDTISTDDLLVQLPDYDWDGFMAKFEETLKEIGAEREWLSKEYDMWNWMYEIWSSSRDRDDTHRLSREMATIIQWTKLKETDLEHAREAHTQSMLAISSVLGIVPKNVTPPAPPSGGKKKQR